jgi:hypothetical protein
VKDTENSDAGHSGPSTFDEVTTHVRARCLVHAEAYEETAWVGVRWRVRGRTFAHVLDIVNGTPASYAEAAGTAGPATVLMVRSSGDELVALRHCGFPFFSTPWRLDEVGMMLDQHTDWDEVAELVTESYLLQAPKRLGGAGRR